MSEGNIQTLQNRIDDLNRRAWESRVLHYEEAARLSLEALHLAQPINYTQGMAEALRTAGFTLVRKGKHEEALPQLNEAYGLFTELNEPHGLSDVYEYLGIVHRNLNDYSRSFDALYKSLELRQRLQYREGEALSHYHLGVSYKYLGNLDKALEHLSESLSICRAIPFEFLESYLLNMIGQVYLETSVYANALEYFEQSLSIRRKEGDKLGEAGSLDNIGFISFKMGNAEQAIDYCSQALAISEAINDLKGQSNALFHLANIYHGQGLTEKALACCNRSLKLRNQLGDKRSEAEALLFLVSFQKVGDEEKAGESSTSFLNKAKELTEAIGAQDLMAQVHYQYYLLYKQKADFEKALHHFEQYEEIEKGLQRAALAQKLLNLEVVHKAEQSRKEAEIYRLRNIELVALYEESQKQKEEAEAHKGRAEAALEELRGTQSQLIQREKMASLGELTAGIAHEIQNPLNFVTNFSESTVELLKEAEKALRSVRREEAANIFEEIKQNLQKITFHGKRADSIVKGMLQHSRNSSGQKFPTDINELVDESLRLSYHGFRAKDNSFTATIQTRYDKRIGDVAVVAQDIGRVLINLFTNAFYAVQEKKKLCVKAYKPTIRVMTRLDDDQVKIRVKDNGTGIPQKVMAKIFHPFFTTKPSGSGTGLGLSLSYDIVKLHGGELKVKSIEGEETEFTIVLNKVDAAGS